MSWKIKISVLSELKREGYDPIQLRKICSTRDGVTSERYGFKADGVTIACSSEREAKSLFNRKVRSVL